MVRAPAPSPIVAAVLATLAAIPALAADPTLTQIDVRAQAERADGPVEGYRAARSATFTKTDTPLKEVPASVTVVPSALMKDQAMQSMADVLRYVPGANVHQGEGNRDQVVLRGNSTNADFYVDGIRDDAQIFRDLYNLERVEVLKGPGGMVFGRGGAGGVVNRVTKQPRFSRVAEAGLTLGDHEQVRANVDLGNQAGERLAWRVNAVAEHARSFREGVSLRRAGINPVLTWSADAATALTVGLEHFEDTRTADRGIPSKNGLPFETGRGTFFGNAQQSEARSTVDSLSAVLEHELAGGVQLKNSFRATGYDKFYQNVYPGSAVNAANTLSIAAYNNANERTNVFNQTDLVATLDAGGMRHTVLGGVELGHQDSRNQRRTGFFGSSAGSIAGIPASNPVATATSFGFRGTDANNRVGSDILGLYAQDQAAFSERWKLVAGLRYDVFKVDFDDRRTTVTPADLQRTDREFSPRLGLIWTPDARATYYASYSYAFLPSGEQLSLATSTADLAPEKSTNLELGARWDLLPSLSLSAAVFRLDKNDVRARDPSGNGQFVKTGQQRTQGVELGLQGNVLPSWQVYAGYAYLDAKVSKSLNTGTDPAATPIPAGRRLALVPRNSLSAWNRFELAAGWGLGLGVVYQGESYASISNAVRLPAFTRFDGALYYGFAGGKARAALNLENLGNRKYQPTADGDNNISQGAPRTARVTLTASF
ncbi:TonB-dependent siderophore receptor [Ramlibacter solisilvae]|uniref:TonB-dependent receptor n=1 Tax=Ramlibacter tataouinensis TaxID=94132 RepID=A0A127JY50_9BURK|nr:TonB-dependent siderophore receptor [Ramlibacter tataouinensis]AMO24861.1 TonB-dependent receptor [Ramlibacter tataouinensis]